MNGNYNYKLNDKNIHHVNHFDNSIIEKLPKIEYEYQ